MRKGERKLFLRVFVIVILVFFINMAAFYIKFGDIDDGSEAINQEGFTGFSVAGDIADLYLTLPFVSKIFLMVQWGLLFLLLIYVGFRDKEVARNKNELVGLDLNQIRKKSETDLDALYSILKQKQQLRISTVSQTFDIKEDLAMEWGKILEFGKLAYIDYPKFGGPVIKIKNKNQLDTGNAEKTKEQLKQENKKIKLLQKPAIKLEQQPKKQLGKQLSIKKLKQQKQAPKQLGKPEESNKKKLDKNLKGKIKKYERKANKIEKNLKKQIKIKP